MHGTSFSIKAPFSSTFEMKYRFPPLAASAIVALSPLLAMAAWKIEPTHTNVTFEVDHLGLTKTPGQFRKFSAEVFLDEKEIEKSRVNFTVDANSIDTLVSVRDSELRREDWFDAERHPNITFVSKTVKRTDDGSVVISGELTVRGKTLPVDFNGRLTDVINNPFLKIPSIGLVATARIKRSDFGMTKFLPAVADEVELRLQTELSKYP
ncbi:MAG: YceI family protein [Variovorax sp.]|nr:YceI family protein [Variovorax sp.]